jgi:hypothetical protein
MLVLLVVPFAVLIWLLRKVKSGISARNQQTLLLTDILQELKKLNNKWGLGCVCFGN